MKPSFLIAQSSLAHKARVFAGLNQMEKVINGVAMTQEDLTTNELESRIKEVSVKAKKPENVMPDNRTPEQPAYAGNSEKEFVNLSLVAYANNRKNQTDKSPDFRIFIKKDNVDNFGKKRTWLQTGAIWKKSGANGEFLSMLLTKDVIRGLLKEGV